MEAVFVVVANVWVEVALCRIGYRQVEAKSLAPVFTSTGAYVDANDTDEPIIAEQGLEDARDSVFTRKAGKVSQEGSRHK